MRNVPPSGRQVILRDGDHTAVVAEVGAALRTYSVGGRDVVVPFGEDEIAPAYHGAVLLPWPNRLRDGRYAFDGAAHQLPVTEPGRRVALHGLACWERWDVREQTAMSVTLRLDLVPQPGYPFPLRSDITYALTDGGLQVTLTTENLGAAPAPYGAGFHPWLSPGAGSLDACELRIDADGWVRPDGRLLPTAFEEIPSHLDFRRSRTIGPVLIDDGFVDATFTDGRSWVRLTGPDGRTAAAWTDRSMTTWQVCTGDYTADPAYVRTGLAAEPMTCVADAFNTGDRLVHLQPGQAHTVTWGLALL